MSSEETPPEDKRKEIVPSLSVSATEWKEITSVLKLSETTVDGSKDNEYSIHLCNMLNSVKIRDGLSNPDIPLLQKWNVTGLLGIGEQGVVVELLDGRSGPELHGRSGPEELTEKSTLDLKIPKRVACKLQRKALTFEREVNALRKFSSLGLATQLYDTYSRCTLEGTPIYILITERIEGTVFDWLNGEQERSTTEVQKLFDAILKLICSLQTHGITHGDMHAGNIGYIRDDSVDRFRLVFIDVASADLHKNFLELDLMMLLHNTWPASDSCILPAHWLTFRALIEDFLVQKGVVTSKAQLDSFSKVHLLERRFRKEYNRTYYS